MSTALPRSATAVALLADIPSTGHVGEVRAQRFSMHGDGIGERSAAFVAFARQQTAAGRKIVALYPSWRADDARRAVNFARGSLCTDDIAGVPLDLAPLALSLVADQLAYLAPYLPPGMVAALSSELPRHLLAGAWLRTVSGLEAIPTSVRQHMGSYAPTVSFLAYCAPVQRVERLRPSEVARRLPFRPVQPVQLLCSVPDPTITGTFDDNLPQAIQPVATRTLPAQPLGPEYWGTAKYVEFVALSAHPQALAYAAGALRASACSWCGEPMTAAPCPFCASGSARSPLRTRMAPPADEPPQVTDTGTWTRPEPRTRPPAPGPRPAAPAEDASADRNRVERPPTASAWAAPAANGAHPNADAPAGRTPAVPAEDGAGPAPHGTGPVPAAAPPGPPAFLPATGSGALPVDTAAAWAARAANGHRTADAPHRPPTAPGPSPTPPTGTGEDAPPPAGTHPDTSAAPGAGTRQGGIPAATGSGALPVDTAAAWAARAANGHHSADTPHRPPTAPEVREGGPPPQGGRVPPGARGGAAGAMLTGGAAVPGADRDHPRYGDHHLPLEAEALPPITVDEDAWHSTADGFPHGAPRRTDPGPPGAPSPGPHDEAPTNDPDRSENPPLAGRAPRPGTPRTYSR
ncbi:hypothetical protein SUDANB121_01855 [Nocardiopsis dassonvillei]|uniref:hypothetical protein n=1 Tax=Nocardiopsis dassonvillei TaxID=2014 RepID=UPI003F57F3BD